MSRIVVLNHITLDGVMQGAGPARRGHPRRLRARRGSMADNDDVMGQVMGVRLAQSGGLLLGRRSYEDMLAYWNTTDSPFKDALNNAPEYVASHTPQPLSWPNSTLLTGDVPKAVSELKNKPGGDLHVMGSGLRIHPLVLGSGHKLFQDGSPPTTLRLLDSVTTTKGLLIATYRPAEAA
jgi:dihydrofolate reductase